MLILGNNEFVSLYLVTELLLEKIRQNKGLTSVDMEELEILITANDSLRAVMVRSIENKKKIDNE